MNSYTWIMATVLYSAVLNLERTLKERITRTVPEFVYNLFINPGNII